MKQVIFGAVAGAMLLAALPARAEILGTGSRAGNYTSSVASTLTYVPINGTAQSIVFNTSAPNQLVRITYNAECGIAANLGIWLSVTIKVDGTEAAPQSGTSFAFCTATSTSTYGWTGAVRQSTFIVPHSGQHKVQVLGWTSGTATWWLGDSSIVVDR